MGIDPNKAASYPHVNSSILQQLCKVLPKDTMALFCSSTEPTSATYIITTVKSMGSLLKEKDKIDALLSDFMQLKWGATEGVVAYTTRVQKSASLLRDTC